MHESNDSDDVVMTASISRAHDDLGMGETTGALDTNADGDALALTSGNLEGRAQINATWHDRFGRVTSTVAFGTYNGSTFDRDSLSVPARSNDALRTDYVYNDDGTLLSVTDPKDLETQYEYDGAGRQITVIANYVNGTPSGVAGDDDVFTRYVYVDGLRTQMWVDFDGDNTQDAGVDQVTTWVYGTTNGGAADESMIATGHLLRRVVYPDSTGQADTVRYAYNAQGQQIYMRDQDANIFEYTYDDAGRRIEEEVTSAPGSTAEVYRIVTSYDDLGRVKLVTQYNRPSGSDVITDELEHHYDGWGNLSMLEQDHDSAIGASGLDEYQVSFSYEKSTDGGRETLRRTGVTYPDSTAITYEYLSTSDFHDDDASRVTRVKVGATVVSSYQYLGASQLAGIDYDEVSVYSRRFDISGSYSAKLDRFNRPIEDTWSKNFSGTETHYFHQDIAWDRNSNITAVDDQVFPDQFVSHTLDDLNRLTDEQRRSASGGGGSLRFRNQRTLSQAGNTTNDELDLNGDTDQLDTGEWDEIRGYNEVNELLGRDYDSGSFGYEDALVYSGRGEMTDDGKNNLLDYDYWGRPRKIKNKSNVVASEYRYNGLGWRISFSDESTSTTYHLAYDDRWRNIATYVDSDDPADPKERMVYDNAGMMGYGTASYIDSIVLRDKDANTAWDDPSDSTLEERLYLLQNWRSDVVMVLVATGSGNAEQVEHVRYEAHGIPTTLPAGDMDRNGDVDSNDTTALTGAWSTSTPRADLNLDNTVNLSDLLLQNARFSAAGGRSILSDRGNRKGYAGYEWDGFTVHEGWLTDHRSLNSSLATWMSRTSASSALQLTLNFYALTSSTVDDPCGCDNIPEGPLRDACTLGCALSDSGRPCTDCDLLYPDPNSLEYSFCVLSCNNANRPAPAPLPALPSPGYPWCLACQAGAGVTIGAIGGIACFAACAPFSGPAAFACAVGCASAAGGSGLLVSTICVCLGFCPGECYSPPDYMFPERPIDGRDVPRYSPGSPTPNNNEPYAKLWQVLMRRMF